MLNVEGAATNAHTFIDPLTGLYNRHGFMEMGRGALAKACWHNIPVTLLYIDIHNFDEFSDNYGSSAADEVLLRISTWLIKTCRSSDLTARLRNDQFAILLPHGSTESGLSVLHRIQNGLNRELQDSRWTITASVGGLTYLVCPSSIESMLQRVDQAVQQMKSESTLRNSSTA